MDQPKGLERRTRTSIDGDQLAGAIARTLGREARATRRRRRARQQDVADAVGISRSRYADLERGEGATAPLSTWARVGAALDRPLAVSFSREITEPDPRDAGHLAAQEMLLRLARATGRRASFELATRPADPARSTDIGLRDSAAKRALVRRYPEVFRSRFPGSSAAWARALVTGERPPARPGVVWIDPRAGRISALRLRGE